MRLLAFSDWRVQSKEMIEKIIQDENPDCVIYAGDDLDKVLRLQSGLYLKSENFFFKVNQKFIEENSPFKISKKHVSEFYKSFQEHETPKLTGIEIGERPFYFVNGNDDNLIEHNGEFLIEKTYSIYLPFVLTDTGNDIRVIESDYSTISAGIQYFYPLAQRPLFGLIEKSGVKIYGSKCGFGLTTEIINLPTEYVDILIVHIPPMGILDLSTRFKTKHIGSESLLEYVKTHQPRFVICGHSHIWGGQSVDLGKTTIINVSSHDTRNYLGNYAIIDTELNKVELKQEKIKTVNQVRGTQFKSDESFKIFGSIKNVYQHDLYSKKNEKIIDSLEKNGRTIIADRIRSFSWEKPKIIKKLSFNPRDYALIDIETGIPKFVDLWVVKCKLWLIGIYYKGEIIQYELPKQKTQFLKFIPENHIKELVSWTSFDSKVLRNMKGLENIKWIDACKRATYSIIWHSYKLHELYDVVFDHKDDGIIDGTI